MGAVLARLWNETTAQLPHFWTFSATRRQTRTESCDMVGEYRADYGPLDEREIQKEIPEVDALLARSEIISAKQGL